MNIRDIKKPAQKLFDWINSLSKRRKLFGGVSFVVILVVAVYGFSGGFLGTASAIEYTEHEVAKASITVSISGSGSIEPINQYEVVSMTGGDVLTDTFEEGDTVEKGQLLYTLDSSDMEKTLERASISLEKSKMTYESSKDTYNGLTISSTATGRVEELYLVKGESINSGSKVAKVVDDSTLTVRVPFNINDVGSFYVGQAVSVTIDNTFEVIQGKISKLYGSNRILDGYITVSDVLIEIENPGMLTSGTYITANINGIDCHEGGELEGSKEQVILSKASGMVEKIEVVEGEYIKSGAVIAQLSSDSAADSLKNSNLSLRESELSYASTEEQLDNYNVTAPISGSVISKTVKAGDTLEESSRTVMTVIADMSIMTFTIDVDELDISKMEAGQKASITADALSDKTFTGTVENIGLLGTSTNGVTSYPVTINIDEAEGLWPGMNVTADIIIDSTEDVLAIPVSAVNRGNTVFVKGEKTSDELNEREEAPEGFGSVQVELGLNDDSMIEVTSGLKEGDIIYVPVVLGESNNTGMPEGMMMPSGGGMPEGNQNGGGGMPGGGGGGGGSMPSSNPGGGM